LLAALLCCPCCAFAQNNTPPGSNGGLLTDADVVALVNAHRPASQIIQLIQHNRGNYELSAAKILSLQRKRVPVAVIDAMLSTVSPADQLNTSNHSENVRSETANETGANTNRPSTSHEIKSDAVSPAPPALPAKPVGSVEDYDEGNLMFQIIGGVEQAGIASNANTTNAFLSAYTSAGPSDRFKLWGRIRLLGQAQASTGGVVSAFQDPTGQIKNLDTQKVGQAVDFVLGPDVPLYAFSKPNSNSQFSIHFVAGVGATTPLSSEEVASKFTVPAKGSPQCGDVLANFTAKNGYPANLILPDPTGTNCLANGITVLAFNRQERTSFLRKYGFGIRTVNKFKFGDQKDQCCEMGTVDFLVGQDEAITGGRLHGWVFRVDGVHPLPIKGKNILYLFGTASIRMSRNQDLRTIVLDADTSNATPSAANVALLPLKQPNKDFYRFGVGLDMKKLFTNLFQTK
jgi:hypothetical protein